MWRLIASLLIAGVLAAGSARAAPPQAYGVAEQAYLARSLKDRISIQLWLIVTGYREAVDAGFSEGLFEAVASFQSSLGEGATGYLSDRQFGRLRSAAHAITGGWGLQKFKLPLRDASLWIPMGLGLKAKRDKDGVSFKNEKKRLYIDFYSLSDVKDRSECNNVSDNYQKKNWKIASFLSADESCSIVASSGSDVLVLRAEFDPRGVVVIAMQYDGSDKALHGDRLWRFMQASLVSDRIAATSPQPDQSAVPATPSPAPPASDSRSYDAARRAFEVLNVTDRMQVQLLLLMSTSEFFTLDPTFSSPLFEAIRAFQAASGLPPTGVLGRAELELLVAARAPLFALWKLGVVDIPESRAHVWMPFGIGKITGSDGVQMKFRGNYDDISITLYRDPGKVKEFYDITMKLAKNDNYDIYHKFLRDGVSTIFVRKNGRVEHFWGVADERGFIELMFAYDESGDGVSANMLELVMVQALFASLSGATALIPPTEASLGKLKAALPASGAASPVPSSPSGASSDRRSFGTGIVINADGAVLTNAHVVEGCRSVRVAGAEGVEAIVLARDTVNDLALLKTGRKAPQAARVRTGLRLGEPVAAFGYPLPGLLSTSGNFTLGNVTALSGVGDDSRFIQISAPIQPGNSGGPLVDASGNLVGVISEKLDALTMMVATKGDVPENIAFAIKGSIVEAFLESNGVAIQVGAPAAALPPADLADVAKGMSVFVQCN